MKKSILKLGKALNRTDQKLINGGVKTCIWCYDYVNENWVCLSKGGDFCSEF